MTTIASDNGFVERFQQSIMYQTGANMFLSVVEKFASAIVLKSSVVEDPDKNRGRYERPNSPHQQPSIPRS